MRCGIWRFVAAGALLLSGAACTGQSSAESSAVVTTVATVLPTTTVAPTTTTTSPPPTTTTAKPLPRRVTRTNFAPFASAQGVTLNYPTALVEKVGFHESNRFGARAIDVLPDIGSWLDMPTRERNTPGRTAADILSDPTGEVRAPVTGRILRGGTYVLYCKYSDSFLVIEPDAHPGWEVKLLHISGLVVRAGDRVEAGVTPVAAHPTRLPFNSQVEDYSVAPVWPHVHLEVVDPTIKNPPGVGGKGCS